MLSVVATGSAALAQTAEVTASVEPSRPTPVAAQPIGYAALPGGLIAPSAEALPKGTLQVATLGGFGWREGLLGETHRFGRGIGNLALAYAPTASLSIALSLDGRFDKHYGLTAQDDGYVGDPRLVVRYAAGSPTLHYGAQLGVWVPGKDAPSVATSAISADARALVALKAGPGWLTFNAGFRLDNSSRSVDNPAVLSVQDRVSLGVSEFNAAIGGVHLGLPLGTSMFLNIEGGVDYFIGDGETPAGATVAHEAPGPLLKVGASIAYALSASYSVLAYVQGAKVPGLLLADVMASDIRLIPYEPVIAGGFGFQARFGGPRGPRGVVTSNPDKQDIAVEVVASVAGQVLDDAGQPVAGAKVTVKLKNNTGTGVSDAKGDYVIERLPIGRTLKGATTLDDADAELTVDAVEGKKPAKQTLTLIAGVNKVSPVTLESELPPGQLRAVVRSGATGKPVAGAKVKIEPGALTATSAADGTFSVDLPPGAYKITVSSPPLKDQQLDVTIDPNGVAIKNIELAK